MAAPSPTASLPPQPEDSTTDVPPLDPNLHGNASATASTPAAPKYPKPPSELNPPVSPRTTVRMLKHYAGDVMTNTEIFRRAGVSYRNGYRYLSDSADKKKAGKRTGRPPKLAKDNVARLLEDIIAGTAGSESTTWDEMKNEFSLECSAATLRRRMTEAGYAKCQGCQKGYLCPQDLAVRREFAAAHALWDSAAWADMYYHDEYHFALDRREGFLHLCASKDRICILCSATSHISRRGYRAFHVWGMVGKDYRSPLVFFNEGEGEDGNLTAEQFYTIMFRPVVEQRLQISELGQKPFVMFEEADATCAEAVGLKVHRNAPCSPDFSIMRGVWTTFRERCAKRKCTTRDELKMVMIEEWGLVPILEINTAIASMPDRMAQCTDRGGLLTKWIGST